MNIFLKYSSFILGGIIGISMFVFKIPINILTLFLISLFIFSVIYIFVYLHIQYKIKLFLSDKEVDLDKLENNILSISNKKLRTYFMINLSVGYSVKKDFEKALYLLEKIDITRQSNKTKVIYYNNMAFFLYKIEKKEEAKDLLEKEKELFEKYLTDITIASILQDTMETVKNNK